MSLSISSFDNTRAHVLVEKLRSPLIIIMIIIMFYINIALFSALTVLYIYREGGISSTTTTTAAILGQNAHHTPAYWWRGDRVMKPISIYGDD